MQKYKHIVFISVCVLILVIVFFVTRISNQASTETAPDTPSTLGFEQELQSEKRAAYPRLFKQASAKLRNNPEDLKQLPDEAERLKDFERAEQESVADVFVLMNNLRLANQGYFPTGLNVEVVNALLGKNYQKVAYLSDSHPKINSQGELVDKWSTPYYFHFISSKHVEIRSAGPDRELFTDDDVMVGP